MRCPVSEHSPPCSGKVVLQTRNRFDLKAGHVSKRRTVKLTSAKFKIGAGATAKLKVKLSGDPLALLKRDASARKAVAIASVSDGAGNKGTVRKQLTVVPKR